ncbi:MAG: hypothetical protein ABH808_00950 [Candidatus Kuenenbacteria bacterium]
MSENLIQQSDNEQKISNKVNKEINQTCQKINYENIINKKFYPVWFFTNERINNFFQKLEGQKEIKRIFSIGGSGDFIFSLLSMQALKQAEEINACDIRQMANISIDFKIGLFKKLKYEEALNLFLKQKLFNKKQIYEKIREIITPLSKKVLDFIIENCKEDNFLKCLRKSNLWYRDSFWQIKNKIEYLPYLTSKEKYYLLRKNLNKISIYSGDFNKNLKLFKDNYFDLIYVSNILDSKKYCSEVNLYLQTIKEKLNEKGLLFVITQNNPKKIIKLVEEYGFCVCEKELHKFNMISSFIGHYSYSFLLFKNSSKVLFLESLS